MRLASYVLSFCLHAAIFLLIWFWPSSPPIKLDTPPVMISLVEGATGGNRTPSPILGHMGQPGDGPLAPTPPAPKAEVAALACGLHQSAGRVQLAVARQDGELHGRGITWAACSIARPEGRTMTTKARGGWSG